MNNSTIENETVYCGTGLYDLQESYSMVHGYTSLIVCYFGCVANILNIAILSRREMRSPTNAILTGLAVADLLVMLDYIPYACHIHLSPKTRLDNNRFSYGWTTFVLFHSLFSQVCHTISICLTVILAVWRYIAVGHPQKNRDWCKMENTLVALILAYILCPIICIPLYLAIGVHSRTEFLDNDGHKIKLTEDEFNTTFTNTTLYFVGFNKWALENNEQYKKINFWIYGVVIKLIPCILLTILSTRLIFALLETKRRRQNLLNSSLPLQKTSVVAENGTSTNCSDASENVEKIKEKRKQKKNLRMMDKERQTDRTTRMLLAVLLLFLVTEFPQGILGLLSAVLGEPFFKQCYIPLGDIMDIIALLNSAINFILYCSMSRQFRTTFRLAFRPRLLNRWLPVAQTPPDPNNGHSTQVTQKRKPSQSKVDINRIGV